MSIKPRVVQRLVLCGDRKVGKTAFMFTGMGKTYPERYVPTIGVDFGIYRCMAEDQYVTLNIWEIAGDKRFLSISNKYISEATIVLYCFDLSNPKTFLSIPAYIKRSELLIGNHLKYIVGFKSDLEKKVLTAEKYANLIDAKYFEVDTKEEPTVLFVLHTAAHDGLKAGTYELYNDDKVEQSNCCYM